MGEQLDRHAGVSAAVTPRRNARARAAAAIVAMVAGGALALGSGDATAAGKHHRRDPASTQRPNIVVIMSDDQTVGEVGYQQHVLDEIGARGATFANNFVNFSLCCPSRSTFLTGLYAHNHHVEGNAPPHGGFDRFERLDANNDLPIWLQRAGYYTGEVGKYLNGYGLTDPTLVPPGWSDWQAVSGTVDFYNYKLNENGTLVGFGSDPADYLDDVITGKAVGFINRNAPRKKPFFLYVAYKAPHSGGPHPMGPRCAGFTEPPPRHFGQFSSTQLPEPPNFNEEDVSDKPRFVQNSPLLTPNRIQTEQTKWQCELESIQGVDDGVNQIIHALRASGELDNTYVLYTSDNGFFHGEHRVFTGKVKVYEPSIRVPLLMRGPGIPAGVTVQDLTINADLAPTIVDLAHAHADRAMNGLPVLAEDSQQPNRELGRELLIEGTNFVAIRTARYKFVQYDDGEQELYDEQLDPYELQNQAGNPAFAQIQSLLASELSRLRDCRKAGCAKLPSVAIHLHYRRGHTARSASCARSAVTASLAGGDASLLTQAAFTLAGRPAGTLTAPPYQIVVQPTQLRARGQLPLGAAADLLDGREMTLAASLPPRCA